MSYHIIVNKNQNVTYGQLLKNRFVRDDVCISRKVEAAAIVVGYSKFYLHNESSRGVALTVNDEVYDVELNICASAADYMLAAKLALAIAEINNATISPEFDDELSLDEFEARYDARWAHSSRLNGADSLKFLLQESDEVKLPGCVRPFYFGNYVLDKISQDQPNEEQFADRVIDEIKNIQFIEHTVEGLEVPTLIDGSFPEGVQTVQVILPEYRLLLQKSDWVILKVGSEILKVDREQFMRHPSLELTRLDESQYVLQPIEMKLYLEIVKHFSLLESPPDEVMPVGQKLIETNVQTTAANGKWWQFWKQ
ncbi:hypothetical protein [Mucilaginibacter rubeus]|uniref:Uncharacterized protein n=1 Tax=Mucilaginibacter rubeus TaxID=2027860 RepID=A0A5C1I5C1_9SPHI|nr:hypothetical protein [Mucilaginibacter rubeus]QEM13034.1 hypothetical protein DEO27_024490 [Mucilaginibacter rubeus]